MDKKTVLKNNDTLNRRRKHENFLEKYFFYFIFKNRKRIPETEIRNGIDATNEFNEFQTKKLIS